MTHHSKSLSVAAALLGGLTLFPGLSGAAVPGSYKNAKHIWSVHAARLAKQSGTRQLWTASPKRASVKFSWTGPKRGLSFTGVSVTVPKGNKKSPQEMGRDPSGLSTVSREVHVPLGSYLLYKLTLGKRIPSISEANHQEFDPQASRKATHVDRKGRLKVFSIWRGRSD